MREYARNRVLYINVRVNAAERALLRELAEVEGLRPSEVLRLLLRQAARERGVWPAPEQQAEGVRHA